MTRLGLPDVIRACLADFRPFDAVADYDEYVDGRPRADGVRVLPASRGIALPEGSDDDSPELDTYLQAAHDLDVEPGAAAVFEDALAGMAAGRSGHFGYVVGVDRVGQAVALREHGEDVVVGDLAELLEDGR